VYVQAIIKVYAHGAARAAGSEGVVQHRPVPSVTSPTTTELMNFEDLSTLSSTLSPTSPVSTEVPQSSQPYDHILNNEQQRDMAKIVHEMRDVIRRGFDTYLKSSDVEVQERSAICLKLLDIHEDLLNQGIDIGPQIASLFEEELNPVARGAQSKVPIPSALNLEDWIGTPFEQLVDPKAFQEVGGSDVKQYSPNDPYSYQSGEYSENGANTPSSTGPVSTYESNRSAFILKSSKESKNNPEIETRNISELGIDAKKKKKLKKGVKKRKASINEPPPVVSSVEELPEGAVEDVVVPTTQRVTDRLSQISLTDPLTDKDILPTVEAYPIKSEAKPVKKATERKKKKSQEEPASTEEKPKRKKKPAASAEEVPPTGEKKKTKKRSTSKSDVREQKAPATSSILEFFDAPTTAESQQAPVGSRKKPVKESSTKKRIAKDDTLRVLYSTKASHPDNMHIHVPIILENNSGSLATSLEYNIESTMNMRLIRPNLPPTATNPVRLPFTLEAGTSNTFNIVLQFKSFARPQQLNGTITYEVDGSQRKLPFTLPLPSSMFLVNKKISIQEFGSLIRGNVMPFPSSTVCPTSEKFPDVKAVAKEICKLLHLSVVDSVDGQVYQMYGTSVQSHHFAIQVKVKTANEVLVELKSSEEQLGTSILGEIHRQFRS